MGMGIPLMSMHGREEYAVVDCSEAEEKYQSLQYCYFVYSQLVEQL